MRMVRCHECGRRYNYDVDDFCPKCGAYTQPARTSRIGADGAVIRVEGLNEANHQKSFVHGEFHEENRERRGTPLETPAKRMVRTVKPVSSREAAATGKKAGASPIGWIIFVIFLLNILSEMF